MLDYYNAITSGSLFNIFNCVPGERGRIFRPEFGSRWMEFLQEPISTKTAMRMRRDMLTAIARFEPRVQIDQAGAYVEADTSLPGYRVRLPLIYPNLPQPQVLQFAVSQLVSAPLVSSSILNQITIADAQIDTRREDLLYLDGPVNAGPLDLAPTVTNDTGQPINWLSVQLSSGLGTPGGTMSTDLRTWTSVHGTIVSVVGSFISVRYDPAEAPFKIYWTVKNVSGLTSKIGTISIS